MPPLSVRRLMLGVVDADMPRCEACRMTLSSSNAPRTDAANRRDTSASSGATLRIWNQKYRVVVSSTGVRKLKLSMMNVSGCSGLSSPPAPAGEMYALISALLG